MSAPLTLRVFIASPSDAQEERLVVRDCVEKVNLERKGSGAPIFELVGWEIVRGTAQRPQEAINKLIHECHFFLAVLKKSWGSDPGGALEYTSGTEEELFTALLDLGNKSRPMRDVWVAFMDAPDAAPEIKDLRTQIQSRHALLYETIATTIELRQKLTQLLHGWGNVAQKEARNVGLIPRSGRDILGADHLRQQGEALVELGYPDAGNAKLETAAEIGGSPEKLAYARVLARQGRMAAAHDIVRRALAPFLESGINSPTAAEVLAAEASLLRRESEHYKSAQRLQQALERLPGDDEYTRGVRCRIRDDLGLAYQKMSEFERAREQFLLALGEREHDGDPRSVAQSLVNIARNDVAMGDNASAGNRASRALMILESLPPSPLHANAQLLRAQTLLRTGMYADAIEHAGMSAVLNEQLSNDYGLAMAENVLAQCFAKIGDGESALAHAKKSLELNVQMGNSAPPVVVALIKKFEH
ncbi:tetratricopeptide repeat protein [Promicromonospora sp. MEB111]|uniref:tetratricopeptide repeat protein n=1 Tax=Promicromonospora sp. MEB111 TaxID=3040301 RepID=UPI002550FBC8|nr:tetratricopeptide repeat protein [Promicromonospora sp. MEB111]